MCKAFDLKVQPEAKAVPKATSAKPADTAPMKKEEKPKKAEKVEDAATKEKSKPVSKPGLLQLIVRCLSWSS